MWCMPCNLVMTRFQPLRTTGDSNWGTLQRHKRCRSEHIVAILSNSGLAVSQLRRLFAGFRPRRSGLDRGSSHWALGPVFSEFFCFTITIIVIVGTTALCEPWPSSELFAILSYCTSVRLLLPWISEQLYFYWCEVVSLTSNSQPGGPVYPSSSGPYPLTCPAWVALPVVTPPPA
jgi:hypothetical protein